MSASILWLLPRRVAAESPAPRTRPGRLRVAWLLLLTALGAGGLIATGVWALLAGSLPPVDGVRTVAGISGPVRIERDARGAPALHGENRQDLAFATGFVHAQDRLFQMDLLRRHTAGELAALLGPGLLAEDRRMRVHRFRSRARTILSRATDAEKALLHAYTAGVAAGRASLGRPPWEYLVVGRPPEPWKEEDTLLVALGMFHMLQMRGVVHEQARGLVDDLLPAPLAEFLSPAGTPWDAPLIGPALAGPVVPGPDVVDLRKDPRRWQAPARPSATPGVVPGSNSWAVTGGRSAHGGAILASDMHLGLFVPGIWYRAALTWPGHRLVGVTLPGTPAMVVGSNGKAAWGFTNLEGDFADLVVLESVADRPGHYRTPNGPRALVRHEETLEVNGGPAQTLVVEETIWGPVFDRDHRGRRRALRWVAHDPEAVNLKILTLETADSVAEVLARAPEVGAPGQNIVVADSAGRIGWTIMGRLPRRIGFTGMTPTSWADGSRHWAGLLPASDYPRLIDPPGGILWSANQRPADEPYLSRLGQGAYDHGARAGQIRDRLRTLPKASELDMLALQLDDRAVFLSRWQQLLLLVLSPAVVESRPRLKQIRDEVEFWGGRAVPDSVGFRIVRQFRLNVREAVLRSLTAPCPRADRRFQPRQLDAGVEESVWQLATRQPEHLLPPGSPSWNRLLLTAVERIAGEIAPTEDRFPEALAGWTWGQVNRARIRHPFSGGLGPVGRWLRLDMPADPLPGDSTGMPRVQAPAAGASERLVVSPGREELGIFHMPAGQSGHPLSPHYRDGHADWVEGRPSFLLPDPPIHVLELRPEG